MENILDNLVSAEDQQLADSVISKYGEAKNATQTMRHSLWKSYLDMYNQVHNTQDVHQYRSKVYVPLVFSQIKTLCPYLTQAVFTTDPVFKLNNYSGLSYDEGKAIERLIEMQIHDTQLYSRLKSFILNMLIYGTAIGKVYWQRDRKKVEKERQVAKAKISNVMFEQVITGIETVTEPYFDYEVEYDGPVFQNIDLVDFYIDPKAHTLEGYWKIHVVQKTLKQMKKANQGDIKIYKNLKALEMQVCAKGSEGQEENIKDERKRIMGINTSSTSSDQKITLLEYWSADGANMCTVALDYGVVVRKEKNPFEHGKAPFVFARFQEVPGEFYGMGVPAIVGGLQRNVNTITNQRNDNINLVLNRMWQVRREANIKQEDLESKPGGIIWCDELDDVKPFDTKDITQSAYMEVQHNKSEAQEAIGTKYISGSNPQGSNRTATGVKLNQAAEAQSVQGVFRELEATCLIPMVEMFYDLNKQFNDIEKTVEIATEEGEFTDVQVPPTAFDAPRKWYASGVRQVMERDTQVHQLTNFLSILQRMPPEQVAAYDIDVKVIIRKIYENMGLDEADRVFGASAAAEQAMEKESEYGEMLHPQDYQQQDPYNATAPDIGNVMSSGNMGGGIQ